MNNRRRLTGFVTSDKMTKTVVVNVTRTYSHPLYKKVVHASNRFKAHDELGAKVGDEVIIVESRPLSREKHWVVESIVRRQGESVELIDAVNQAVAEAPGAVIPELIETEAGETETAETEATDAAAADTTATEPVEGE